MASLSEMGAPAEVCGLYIFLPATCKLLEGGEHDWLHLPLAFLRMLPHKSGEQDGGCSRAPGTGLGMRHSERNGMQFSAEPGKTGCGCRQHRVGRWPTHPLSVLPVGPKRTTEPTAGERGEASEGKARRRTPARTWCRGIRCHLVYSRGICRKKDPRC